MSKALNIPWNSVKSIIKKWKEYGTCVNVNQSSPKGMWDTPWSSGRKFCGLMRPKWSFLAIRQDAMFGVHQTLHTTTNTPSTL